MMMRGRLHLRRGPLASAWRSSAWLICGRGWASKCALLQSSWHLAWLVAHWLALLFVFIYAHIHRLVLTCNISTVHLCVFQRHRPCFAPDDAGVAARRRALHRPRGERARAAPHRQCRLR